MTDLRTPERPLAPPTAPRKPAWWATVLHWVMVAVILVVSLAVVAVVAYFLAGLIAIFVVLPLMAFMLLGGGVWIWID